ncbi:hypothetical protein C8Q74DRAFT_1208681 [Fomes fomentarius]|nr:hypothetical protein C8Q74DRAFT_1208681 [Fomes fomentarius]
MIAVQKPPSFFSTPAFRPMHVRHPSAPVVVRPSLTPGVLNIAKPVHTVPRAQLSQAQPRAPRASPKCKPQQRSPQPSHAQAVSVEKTKAPSSSPANAEQSLTSLDKSTRGRKQHKQPKDAAARSTSVSPSDVAARRHAHQPSPPRIPSPQKATLAPRAQVSRGKPDDSTASIDPFVDDAPTQVDSKALRPPPKLASQPSGKLARRRQASTQLFDTPTPKVSVRRKPGKAQHEMAGPLQPAFSHRRPVRRASTDLTLTRLDSFPICDDSSEFGDDSDTTPPTSPIREASSVPAKGAKGTWLQGNLGSDDVPRTAPLSSAFGFPPVGGCSTPTPAQRRRNHRRVPSEGVFHMSSDEGSPSSSVTDLFEQAQLKRRTPVSIPRQRYYTAPASSPSFNVGPAPFVSSSAPAAAAGYFAGSVFQNSPSPDDLPAPTFAL